MYIYNPVVVLLCVTVLMHKGHFLKRVETIIGISALALLITSLSFASIGFQREQELIATLLLNETALVGPPGKDGEDGALGTDGRNGTDGAPGTPGANGTNGATGPSGFNGTDGAPGPTGPTGSAGISGVITGIQFYAHQEAAATDGGTLTSGTWNVRTINTVLSGGNLDGVFTSLASNTITFQPGVYRVRVSASVAQVQQNILRIQDVTTTTTLVSGLSTGIYVMNAVHGIFNITAARDVQIQHWCQTTITTTGMGASATGSPGVPNTYLLVEIMKLYT